MKTKIFIFVVLLLALSPAVLADDDIEVFGLELEKLLNLGSGILALGLFVVTAIAYKRNQRSKLLFICLAFLLFSLKGFLTAHELFIPELEFVDPIASFLDFGILLSFFTGVLKR
tara:strand:- start:882 stop:1226 length:345 start_codon:yes stop_codon:yes gene_type:complete